MLTGSPWAACLILCAWWWRWTPPAPPAGMTARPMMWGSWWLALAWMADHSRSVHPKKIVWLQDDVTHRNFYWLEAEEPKAGARLVAECQGQTIRILEAKDAGALVVHLSDALIDLDRPIRVERDGVVVHEGKVQRSVTQLQQSMERFGDPQRVYSSSIRVPVPTSR